MPLNNLKGEMKRIAITQNDVADLLHMSTGNVNKKIAGSVPFTIDEARSIRDTYFPEMTIDFLFSPAELPA